MAKKEMTATEATATKIEDVYTTAKVNNPSETAKTLQEIRSTSYVIGWRQMPTKLL